MTGECVRNPGLCDRHPCSECGLNLPAVSPRAGHHFSPSKWWPDVIPLNVGLKQREDLQARLQLQFHWATPSRGLERRKYNYELMCMRTSQLFWTQENELEGSQGLFHLYYLWCFYGCICLSGFGHCPASSWTFRAMERVKQLQECLRTGLYVWCGRWEKTSRSLNGFLWQASEIFCTQNLLLLAFCCRSTIKGKPLWRHRDQQPLFGEEMCPDLPSISHLFCPWDSHKGTLIQVATSSAPESFWVKSRSCVVKVDTFIMLGTFPLCLLPQNTAW